MPVTKKEPIHPRLTNKANRARHAKETKQIKILKISGLVILGFIAAILIFGAIYEFAIKPNKVLAKINDQKITVSKFEKTVRYQRNNLIRNYEYMQQLYQSFGMQMDENTRMQYEMQLAPEYAQLLGSQVYTSLVDQQILDYTAKEAGYSVSPEEVDTRFEELFGYYPNGTPTAEPTKEPIKETPTPSEEQLKLLNYTATPEPTEVPAENDLEGLTEEIGPSGDVELTLEPAAEAAEEVSGNEISEEEAAEEVETEEATEDDVAEITDEMTEDVENEDESAEEAEEVEATPAPTATVYSEDLFKDNVTDYYNNNEYSDMAFEKEQIYFELLRNKVRADIEKAVPREEDMVWARHILVETEEEANAVLERLEAGEDFATVATEVSTDTGSAVNGGDLGWFGKGRMVAPFEEAAYAQEIGSISTEPVATDYGFHIIQIIGHEMHPLTESEISTRIDSDYTKWLDAGREKLNVTLSEDWQNFVPTEPKLLFNSFNF